VHLQMKDIHKIVTLVNDSISANSRKNMTKVMF
jgi:hypothetical protein